MNIDQRLTESYDKENILEVAAYIGSDVARFKQLMESFFGDDKRRARYASWVMMWVLERNPHLGESYLTEYLEVLRADVHAALKRAILRSMEMMEVPEPLHGPFINVLFDILMDSDSEIAEKVFAMTVIYKFTFIYPDLFTELASVIESQMEYGSAGFKSRGRHILSRKYKLRSIKGK